MLEFFEEYTAALTEEERQTLLPLMVRSLKQHVGRENAVTNKRMREGLEAWGYKVSDARIRKLINHIRRYSRVECLMATGKGYYVTEDVAELEQYLKSLEKRAKAISEVKRQISSQLENLKRKQGLS